MRHPFLIAATGLAMTFGAIYASLNTSVLHPLFWGFLAFAAMGTTMYQLGKS